MIAVDSNVLVRDDAKLAARAAALIGADYNP